MSNNNFLIYGLQRSGTNVIQDFLTLNFNIRFLNIGIKNISRNHFLSKHFRIYDEKEYIPVKQYRNNIVINSINDLDTLINLNKTNKYIVVYKDVYSWLLSIDIWGNMNNWNIKNRIQYVNDYLLYMKKWSEIKSDNVLFINYREYLECKHNINNKLIEKINNFLKLNNIQSRKFIFPSKVNVSNKTSLKKEIDYLNKKYLHQFSKNEIDYIKNHPLFKNK
jgi:hypothetical protein